MAHPDWTLTPIGFGAFKIGRNRNIRYAAGYDLPDEAEAERLLNGVLDLGINSIDTAPAYGVSEERIGRAIGHRRGEYFLSTKVGETFTDGVSTYDFSAEGVRRSIEQSLRRLNTDVLDLVFVHASHDDLAVVEKTDAVPTLRRLREQGVTRAIGLSGYTMAAFRSALDWADALMLEYHARDRSLEPVIAEAAARGIAVMVKKGLASGTLNPGEAMPFILTNPCVTSVVIGSLSLAHLRENLALAERVRGVPASRMAQS